MSEKTLGRAAASLVILGSLLGVIGVYGVCQAPKGEIDNFYQFASVLTGGVVVFALGIVAWAFNSEETRRLCLSQWDELIRWLYAVEEPPTDYGRLTHIATWRVGTMPVGAWLGNGQPQPLPRRRIRPHRPLGAWWTPRRRQKRRVA